MANGKLRSLFFDIGFDVNNKTLEMADKKVDEFKNGVKSSEKALDSMEDQA